MEENRYNSEGRDEQSLNGTQAPVQDVRQNFNWDYSAQDKYNENKRKKESRRSAVIYAVTALAVFALGFAGIGAVALLDSYTHITKTIEKENVVYIRETDSEVLSVAEIAGRVKPSVAVIECEGEDLSAGSGFFISTDGYIATNWHVVGESDRVKVTLFDGSEHNAQIVGVDRLSDLALLKIDGEGYPAVKVGDSSSLVVGEDVVAIGNPYGMSYKFTVTDGIISAVDRRVEVTGEGGSVEKTMTLIQTNADLNHGNSGGPLVNAKGEVIGINVIRLESGYTGVGFAIPINEAMELLEEIRTTGKDIDRNSTSVATRQAALGITGKAVTVRSGYDVNGVLVEKVFTEYDAYSKGVKAGDIVVNINGKPVSGVEDIKSETGKLTADDSVVLRLYRDGEYIEITVRLGYAR